MSQETSITTDDLHFALDCAIEQAQAERAALQVARAKLISPGQPSMAEAEFAAQVARLVSFRARLAQVLSEAPDASH